MPPIPSEKNPPEDTNTGIQVKTMTWIVLALCNFGMIVIFGRRYKLKIIIIDNMAYMPYFMVVEDNKWQSFN